MRGRTTNWADTSFVEAGSVTGSVSTIRLFLDGLVRDRLAVALVAILLLIVVSAILAPWVAPYPPDEINVLRRFSGPSRSHWLGTDELGRDVLSRFIHAGRVSLLIGVSSAAISLAVGSAVGAVSGYVGGWVDSVLMRFTDAALSIPRLFLLLAVSSVFVPSLSNIILVIALTSWMPIARLVHGLVLKVRQQEFITGSQALGASDWRLLWQHVFPQTTGTIIVAATLGIAYAILLEAALSFLGLGVQPPTATWGSMLGSAQIYLWTAPHLAIFPGLAIFVTVLAFNSLGDVLRDALDPRGRDLRR